ncbi:MAG TPA: RyR domain-containing protein [Tepidisphaeraceae bacterium]|jgi:cation transport ATPase|nr:RyR domain-containing protein [Tepidisphaeraceae bacterium]
MDDPPKSYTPRPIDTSRVAVDPELQRDIEVLSRNVHELWAQQRSSEGWVYGPLRDQARKAHPGLVPFDSLDAIEQNYDRLIASQTVKALRTLGYQFRRSGSRPETSAADEAAEQKHFDEQARQIERRILAALEPCDVKATRLNAFYRNLAWYCSILGTLAVLLAIGQMFVSEEHHALQMTFFIIEGFCALAVGFGVIYGLWTLAQHRWLLERYKSERLRALHGWGLIALAEGKLDSEALDQRIDEIAGTRLADLHEWLARDVETEKSAFGSGSTSPRAAADAFRTTYLQARLTPQSQYLTQAEARHEHRDRMTRRIPPFLFFVSVGCVAIHVLLHPFHHEATEHVANVMLLLAAMLPVIASGLRTYREAVQFSRNAARFGAKKLALGVLREEMLAAGSEAETLECARRAENLLESENREWLRLMIDAEWFA